MEPKTGDTPSRARNRGFRLSLIELFALCIVVAAVTVTGYREWLRPHFYFSDNPLEELKELERYGPKFSMGVKEWSRARLFPGPSERRIP